MRNTKRETASPQDFFNKEVSGLRKIPAPDGDSISGPFMPADLDNPFKRFKAEKSPVPHSVFKQFILHAGSALKSWLCGLFTSCIRLVKNPQDLEKTTSSCDPEPDQSCRDRAAFVV